MSINASDNFLPLGEYYIVLATYMPTYLYEIIIVVYYSFTEAFHTFPALEELELSLNGIAEVAIEPDHFAMLCTLDLSYNLLCEWALLALGTLPKLKELHLTGTCISSMMRYAFAEVLVFD